MAPVKPPIAHGIIDNPKTSLCDALKVLNQTSGCNFSFIPAPSVPVPTRTGDDFDCDRVAYAWSYMFKCNVP